MSNLSDILARIEQRLTETGQSATAASKDAGKPDAIRNMKRAILDGRKSGVSTETLMALAKQLDTSVEWLMTGSNKEPHHHESSHGISVDALLAAVEGSYLMLGLDEEEAAHLLSIVIEAAEEQPTPSAGPDYHRVLAETQVRKFLKSIKFEGDGA